MNAIPPSFTAAFGSGQESFAEASAISLRWEALGDAANVVAMLAGIEPERTGAEAHNFSALIRNAETWRRERAENGVADLATIMEPGIAALLAVNARGIDPQPAAMALWREFVAARAAVLALLSLSPSA